MGNKSSRSKKSQQNSTPFAQRDNLPIVSIHGPEHAGKGTLFRHALAINSQLMNPSHQYLHSVTGASTIAIGRALHTACSSLPNGGVAHGEPVGSDITVFSTVELNNVATIYRDFLTHSISGAVSHSGENSTADQEKAIRLGGKPMAAQEGAFPRTFISLDTDTVAALCQEPMIRAMLPYEILEKNRQLPDNLLWFFDNAQELLEQSPTNRTHILDEPKINNNNNNNENNENCDDDKNQKKKRKFDQLDDYLRVHMNSTNRLIKYIMREDINENGDDKSTGKENGGQNGSQTSLGKPLYTLINCGLHQPWFTQSPDIDAQSSSTALSNPSRDTKGDTLTNTNICLWIHSLSDYNIGQIETKSSDENDKNNQNSPNNTHLSYNRLFHQTLDEFYNTVKWVVDGQREQQQRQPNQEQTNAQVSNNKTTKIYLIFTKYEYFVEKLKIKKFRNYQPDYQPKGDNSDNIEDNDDDDNDDKAIYNWIKEQFLNKVKDLVRIKTDDKTENDLDDTNITNAGNDYEDPDNSINNTENVQILNSLTRAENSKILFHNLKFSF